MYKHILVATGGSPWSDAAVAYAIAIAARTGASLRILTVLVTPAVFASPDDFSGAEVVAEIVEADGQSLLTRAAEQAQQAGVACETLSHWGNVPETILQTAAEAPCDLIVMGAHLVTGWRRLRLGHIANAVAAKAPQPVLVVKQPPAVEPGSPLGRRVLVATGGSPWSDRAVEHAIALAQTGPLSLCLLHVVPGRARRRQAGVDPEGQRILERTAAWAQEADVAATTVLARGDVPRTIVQTAVDQACDSMILGSRGSSGWKRLMLGSISNAVIVTTTLPVLVVKRFFEG